MNEIGVGVIGLGSIGLRMLAAFDEHPDFVGIIAWDPRVGFEPTIGVNLCRFSRPVNNIQYIDIIILN